MNSRLIQSPLLNVRRWHGGHGTSQPRVRELKIRVQKAAWRLIVKLEDYTYKLVMKTLEVLEKQYNYKVSEEVKKELAESVIKDMNSLIS